MKYTDQKNTARLHERTIVFCEDTIDIYYRYIRYIFKHFKPELKIMVLHTKTFLLDCVGMSFPLDWLVQQRSCMIQGLCSIPDSPFPLSYSSCLSSHSFQVLYGAVQAYRASLHNYLVLGSNPMAGCWSWRELEFCLTFDTHERLRRTVGGARYLAEYSEPDPDEAPYRVRV